MLGGVRYLWTEILFGNVVMSLILLWVPFGEVFPIEGDVKK